MKLFYTAALTSAICYSAFAGANENLEGFSPVVVSSTPIAGSEEVDPSVKQIEVQFSKPMQSNKMWSIVTLKNTAFPKVTGQVYFKEDARTFVIPVKLEANTVYGFSVNSKNKTGFKGVNGKPAQPYTISFKTAS